MPGDLTRSQADALGRRLAHADEPANEDLDLLARFQGQYLNALEALGVLISGVTGGLSEGKFESATVTASNRVKTVDTIIEKLRRGTSLSTMQDIVGYRLVAEMTLETQDGLVAALVSRLPASRVVDRRKNPMFGYRAVHIVARVQRLPVEIQVRTRAQDGWAQVMEGLADVWGRGIRYGEPPSGGNEVARAARATLVRDWQNISALYADTEDADSAAQAMKRRADELKARHEAGEPDLLVELTNTAGEATAVFQRSIAAYQQSARALELFDAALYKLESEGHG